MHRCVLTTFASTARRSACLAPRALATVVPPPPRPDVEKMPGEGATASGGGGALGSADSRDLSASERQAATASPAGGAHGPGAPPPMPEEQRQGEEKKEEEQKGEEKKAEEEGGGRGGDVEVGQPPAPYAPRHEIDPSDADVNMVHPSDVKTVGDATTVAKGKANTMKAPEVQSSG